MNNISTNNIYKSFKHNDEDMLVLEDINISINHGDKVAITGESGAGKSTLLQILAGLDSPSKGIIKFGNQDASLLSSIEKSNVRLHSFGFVYQFHHLLEDLTVFENVLLPQELMPSYKYNDASKKVDYLLDQLGLKSRANFLPWKLSGGEKQRVAIARAVINNPQFLFLDEPTGNLDNKNANLVQDLIIQIADEHKLALILSTHDNSFAQRMDNIYKISNRNIIEV
jgi:lipoprotein-releasing system ATP-binding protein